MTTFVKQLTNHLFKRTMDCACGDVILTEDFLIKYYDEVHMFDQCEVACSKAHDLYILHDKVKIP